MGKLCSVKSCPSGRKLKSKGIDTSQPLSFFRPTTPEKLKKWNIALGTKMKKTDYICHLHFKEEDIKMYEKFNINGEITILPTGKKTLRVEALPTIEHQFIPIPVHDFQGSIINKSQKQSFNHNKSEEKLDHQDKSKQQEFLVDQGVSDRVMHVITQSEHDLEILQLNEETHNDKQNDKELEVTSSFQSTEKFLDNLKSSVLPQGWMYFEKPQGLEFFRLDAKTMQIVNRLRVNKDLSVTVIFSTNEELTTNDNITLFNTIYDYLTLVAKWPLCVGIQIDKKKYSQTCKGVIFGDDSYTRNQANPRCKSCRVLRHRLQNCNSASNILETTISQKRRASNLQKRCKRLKKMITAEDRICRPCLQRANYYMFKQKRVQEAEEAVLESQRIAVNEVYQDKSETTLEPQLIEQSVTDDGNNSKDVPGPSKPAGEKRISIDLQPRPSVSSKNNQNSNININEYINDALDTTDFQSYDEYTIEDVPPEPPKEFSWQEPEATVDLAQDEDDGSPEYLEDDLSLYCSDDEDKKSVLGIRGDEGQGFQCNSCTQNIVGFRYACVQCADFDLCSACEARGVHDHHYVLRVPGPRPHGEVQKVLARIRKYLLGELDPIKNDFDNISIKSEVKDEDEEELLQEAASGEAQENTGEEFEWARPEEGRDEDDPLASDGRSTVGDRSATGGRSDAETMEDSEDEWAPSKEDRLAAESDQELETTMKSTKTKIVQPILYRSQPKIVNLTQTPGNLLPKSKITNLQQKVVKLQPTSADLQQTSVKIPPSATSLQQNSVKIPPSSTSLQQTSVKIPILSASLNQTTVKVPTSSTNLKQSTVKLKPAIVKLQRLPGDLQKSPLGKILPKPTQSVQVAKPKPIVPSITKLNTSTLPTTSPSTKTTRIILDKAALEQFKGMEFKTSEKGTQKRKIFISKSDFEKLLKLQPLQKKVCVSTKTEPEEPGATIGNTEDTESPTRHRRMQKL